MIQNNEIVVTGIKQKAVLDYLNQHDDDVEKSTLMQETKAANATIKSLIDKGIIVEKQHEFYREVEHMYAVNNKRVILNDEQQVVYDTISGSMDHHQVFLLHGVTGSGKT